MRTVICFLLTAVAWSCANPGSGADNKHRNAPTPSAIDEQQSSPTAKDLAERYYDALTTALGQPTPEFAQVLFAERRREVFRQVGFQAWKECAFTKVVDAEFSTKDGREGIRTVVTFECPTLVDTETKFLFKTENGYVLDEL